MPLSGGACRRTPPKPPIGCVWPLTTKSLFLRRIRALLPARLGVQQDDGEAFALLDRFAEAYDREKPDDGETSTYPDELVGIVYNGLGELYADGRGGVDIKEAYDAFRPPPNWATATPDAISADSKGTGSASG